MSDLLTILERQATEGDTSSSSVGDQRERNHRFYSMQPMGNERDGRSQYVDPAVFSSVEDKKSVYSQAFLSSRQVVRFNGQNSTESEAKTAYAQRVMRDNKYHELFMEGFHNAFVAKKMTVWVSWERVREQVTLNFLGAPSQVVNMQLQQLGEITNVDREGLESQPIPSLGQVPQFVHTGTLTVEVDKSYIRLDLIKPEYVFRDSAHSFAADATYNGCREDMSRLEMIDRGFLQDQVEKLNPDHRWRNISEDEARKQHDGTGSQSIWATKTGSRTDVGVYKTRTWLMPDEIDDIEGFEPEDGPAIYEIYWAQGEVLRWSDDTPAVRVLDEMAVCEFTEFQIAHSEHGMCTADVEAHQQKATSGLKRGILDNMAITNNPRYEAAPDALRDMRDLYENTIGGVVETETGYPVGQVKALDQPQLSPMVMGVLQMLDQDSQERSGQSNVSTGMNTDVISAQNAENMVDKIAARGERRVAMGVRNFANTFLIPLLQTIVRLGMKHDKSQDQMESGGRQVPIIPSQWSDDEEMEVEVALTPGEAATMSAKLLVMDSKMSQDEDMKPLYTIQQKHALYDTVFELMGIKDSTQFMGSPESPQVQQSIAQRQQMMQQQMAEQQQDKEFQKQMMADAAAREWSTANSKIMDTIHDNQLADDQFDMDNFFKRQEIQLEREQERGVSV